ncbi:MAG: glycoside hydrolase family 5 protein [Bacteroidota bacterium]
MKTVISILLSFVFTATFAQRTPVSTHGQLNVSKGRIVDKNNLPPQLRGISMSWSIWGGHKYYNPQVIDWLTTDFEVSVIRLSMAVEHEHGYLADSAGQYNLITSSIDAAIKNGLYVIVDWHDHHAIQHQTKAINFFSQISKRYTGKQNIIYEVFNEPERVNWKDVKEYSIQVIKAIRKFDQKNLIVAGSPSWDQDVDVAAKDPITGFSNIAYSFHFYASDPNHQEKLMSKADEAIRLGLPLFVTEWGVGESNGDGVFNKKTNTKWLNWMEQNKLSWTNWNLTDKKETTALVLPGASANGGWSENNLSPAGQYIRKVLKNSGKTVK